MKENMPNRLAAFSFIFCFIGTWIFSLVDGGDVSGVQNWPLAIGFVLFVSTAFAFTVWIFSRLILMFRRMILAEKQRNA